MKTSADIGYERNARGDIDIHVAAEKPAGVPDENWLPIAAMRASRVRCRLQAVVT